MSGTLLKPSKKIKGDMISVSKTLHFFSLKTVYIRYQKALQYSKKKEWKLKAKTSQQEIRPNYLQRVWANKLYKEMVGSHLLEHPPDAVSFIKTRRSPVWRSYSVKCDGSVMTKRRGETNIAPLRPKPCNCKADQSMPSRLFSLGNHQCWLPNSMLLFIVISYYDSAYSAGHNMITFTQPNSSL